MNFRKHYLFISFILLGVTNVCFGEPSMIKIDHAHSQISDAGENALRYKISPSEEIKIDYDGYIFDIWGQEETPDTLSVLIGNERQYYIKLKVDKNKYTFTPEDFIPREGTKKFVAFLKGDTAILALGNLRIDTTNKEEKLRVQWVGMLEVL